ncbi:glycoside hydrolase 5 family protein [Flavobacterium pallidum]|uniref:mannan endo-1,4-beta-mannosidase n=1 Tax=Flavobacterium pallidum TaxID=2172098 RepID=A0A2S1SHP3_9FLAO|nr:cellulase family glycosylhydrolase [Flavobacterium pallidum]AWI25933.1 beta-mannanase [Flavobacterium pallidum]
MKKTLYLLLVFCTFGMSAQKFVTIKGTAFFRNGKNYSYIGANYWYGALLGTKDGDRPRLLRELDLMKKYGITNLRIMVGADGGKYDFTVRKPLQTEQGKYDADVLDGLDFLLSEMGKRDMTAVLYLTNNWEWSGGMAQYLEWNGKGVIPNPNTSPENTWDKFMDYVAQFHSCEPCKTALDNHIKFIIGRKNNYTKKNYTEDPAIMAWQVANEPRVFTPGNETAFTDWLNKTVNLIDSLDKNHLICTGSEGRMGNNGDLPTFERTHANPKIDYLTMHIWPKNWNWFKADNAKTTLPIALTNTENYIDEHVKIARKLGRPIVIEEFGLPRENESLSPAAGYGDRLHFYNTFFTKLSESLADNDVLRGINFWGFGGEGVARNDDGKWNTGDPYTADPPQEPQGLNTVFSSDTALLELIKQFNQAIGNY